MDNHIHFKEDMAKPENRTNLAFFSILMIPEIHSFVCKRLRLSDEVIILPCPNLSIEEFDSCMRPDFRITESYPGHENDTIGFIEVELGIDDAQLQRYRDKLSKKVYSIVGKKSHCENEVRGDLSLEEIYEVASVVKESCINTQKYASLHLFCTLVKYYVIDGKFRSSSEPTDISEEVFSSRLIQKVYNYFGEDNILRNTYITPGKILLNARGGKYGFSLRVYCSESKSSKDFSLMNRTTSRPQVIRFPSLSRLRKWFPMKEKDTEFFAETIATLGAQNVYTLPIESPAILPIKTVEDNFEKICDAIKRFLECKNMPYEIFLGQADEESI